MLRSMTAYANGEARIDTWAFSWELRSVNHRFLDVSLRLPDSFRFLESDVRARIAEQLRRGRVECTLGWKAIQESNEGLSLNLDRLGALLAAAERVEQVANGSLAPFNALDLMRWPGVIEECGFDRDRMASAILVLLDQVLMRAVAAREQEGQSLCLMLQERLRKIESRIGEARERVPAVLVMQRERLLARLAEVAGEPENERFHQELVYWAQKLDVTEELDRLAAHVAEFQRLLEPKDSVGRRLDFLSQEMNREANTLGSKSADIETTRAAVDVKVLIEQIREQVQNVE